MRVRHSTATDRTKVLGHGTPHRQIAPRRGIFRRPRFRPGVELLDVRTLLSTVTLTGNVFLQQDVSGNYTFPEAVSGNFLGPVEVNGEGVTVTLDNTTPTTTDSDGNYTFDDVATGTHIVTVTPPAATSATPRYLGFNSQSLSYTLTVPNDVSNYTPPPLNFMLTPQNQAVVQNLYEMVLSRPADFDGFNTQLGVVGMSGDNVGQVFTNLYTSSEFAQESQPIANLIEAFMPGPLSVGAFRESVQLQNLGTAQDATALQFLYSQPFVAKFGNLSKLTNVEYVNFMYQHLLKRMPTKDECTTWVNLLSPQGEQAPLANRGDLPLSLVNSSKFQNRLNVIGKAGVSLVYLGVLGREPTAKELMNGLKKVTTGVKNGMTVSAVLGQVANGLAQGSEYQNLPAYKSTFYSDVQTDQIPTTVTPITRLEKYDTSTGQFDKPVEPRSITSTKADPVNAYFIVHGWAPGLTQEVLLNSTPSDPEKAGQTDDTPWLVNKVPADGKPNGVPIAVSDQGLAQAILAANKKVKKKAEVFEFSWIDQSATPSGSIDTVSGKLTKKSAVVQQLSTGELANLAVGMDVTGPGIAPGTYIQSTNNGAGPITLSAPASASILGTLSVYTSVFTIPATVTGGKAVISGIDTTRLVPGMTVTDSSSTNKYIPSNTSIASLTGFGPSQQITLSAPANAIGTSVPLTFTGQNLTYLPNQSATWSTSLLTSSGLETTTVTLKNSDTSQLTAGMTVIDPSGDIPFGDTIYAITSQTQFTLKAEANTDSSSALPLTFSGTNLGALLQQNLYAGQSESYTQQNGLVMAQAIKHALAPNFFTVGAHDPDGEDGLIQIMGHSHGSKVATIAALALQKADVPVAQLTLLESPEDGPYYNSTSLSSTAYNTALAGLGGAQNFNWYYLDQMNISSNPVTGGVTGRTSTDSTFVDNYYSNQGLGSALGGFDLGDFGFIPGAKNELSNIVDVELHPEVIYGQLALRGNSSAVGTILQSHGYPPPWYGQTADGPQDGINWSPLINASAPSGLANSYQQTVLNPSGYFTAGNPMVSYIKNAAGVAAGMPVSDETNPADILPGTIIQSISGDTWTLSQAPVDGSDYLGDTLNVLNQSQLAQSTLATFKPSAQKPLAYATEGTTGSNVTDNGSSITLSVNKNDPTAVDEITYTPLAVNGTSNIPPNMDALGAGMDFTVSFDVKAGEDVQLVVWLNGLAAAPEAEGNDVTGSTMGYMSIPLYTMNSADAGNNGTVNATISLGGYLNSDFATGPFNSAYLNFLHHATSSTILVPTLGFTLVSNDTNNNSGKSIKTSSVTVSAMNQFAVG